MASIEPEILKMIKERGQSGKLKLSFDGLDFFGTPEKTQIVFMKLKENE